MNGRLGTERGGGAWCPASLVSHNTGREEWLQIDMGREVVVTGIITQGRYARGQGQEYAEFVSVLVWNEKEEEWKVARVSKTDSEVIKANNDTYSKVEIELHDPVVTSKIRIVPVSVHPRMVCIRGEILGCDIRGKLDN